ncbi:MAG: Txe/YoeB family addiction module toxin [Fimbriimonadaceae bacterium]|nr:Txe/YoeB family addiction module toxin [Fimbriimonadaceae bacterium]
MDVLWSPQAEEDLRHWAASDPAKVARIARLVDDVKRHPFTGLGKPEALRHSLAGLWSRRIDREHRLVYRVEEDRIQIVQARYHY